jgi:hypothetical protein
VSVYEFEAMFEVSSIALAVNSYCLLYSFFMIHFEGKLIGIIVNNFLNLNILVETKNII